MSQRKDTGLNTNPWPKLVDHYNHTWLNEVPATKEECQHLEVAAAWDPCHIEERLNEHYGLQ